MAEVGTPISEDAVAVHPDCWCVCLCLHSAPENPEEVAEAVREKRKSMETGKKENRQGHGRSTRRVNKTQRRNV